MVNRFYGRHEYQIDTFSNMGQTLLYKDDKQNVTGTNRYYLRSIYFKEQSLFADMGLKI